MTSRFQRFEPAVQHETIKKLVASAYESYIGKSVVTIEDKDEESVDQEPDEEYDEESDNQQDNNIQRSPVAKTSSLSSAGRKFKKLKFTAKSPPPSRERKVGYGGAAASSSMGGAGLGSSK